MAKHIGINGVVKSGANVIVNMKTWSFSEDSPQIDVSVMNDTFASGMAGLPASSGSFTTLWDPTDATGQGTLTVGASVTLKMYPDGSTTGDYLYTVTVEITNVTVNSSHDAAVERSYTWVGTTAVVESTEP